MRVMDGHTDKILIARPRLHSMQRSKKWLIAINRFLPEKCHKVHQLSTTDALCSSR